MQKPELFTHSGFAACGISTQTTNALEAQPASARIPRLWQRFYAEALPARLGANAANGRVVGVYSSYENGSVAGYIVTAGVQLVRDPACPTGFETVVVSAGEYLRFTAYGTGPDAVAKAWAHVHDFFSHAEHPLAGKYERAYTADYLRYGDPETVSLFIAVKRKLGVHVTAERVGKALRQV